MHICISVKLNMRQHMKIRWGCQMFKLFWNMMFKKSLFSISRSNFLHIDTYLTQLYLIYLKDESTRYLSFMSYFSLKYMTLTISLELFFLYQGNSSTFIYVLSTDTRGFTWGENLAGSSGLGSYNKNHPWRDKRNRSSTVSVLK